MSERNQAKKSRYSILDETHSFILILTELLIARPGAEHILYPSILRLLGRIAVQVLIKFTFSWTLNRSRFQRGL